MTYSIEMNSEMRNDEKGNKRNMRNVRWLMLRVKVKMRMIVEIKMGRKSG